MSTGEGATSPVASGSAASLSAAAAAAASPSPAADAAPSSSADTAPFYPPRIEVPERLALSVSPSFSNLLLPSPVHRPRLSLDGGGDVALDSSWSSSSPLGELPAALRRKSHVPPLNPSANLRKHAHSYYGDRHSRSSSSLSPQVPRAATAVSPTRAVSPIHVPGHTGHVLGNAGHVSPPGASPAGSVVLQPLAEVAVRASTPSLFGDEAALRLWSGGYPYMQMSSSPLSMAAAASSLQGAALPPLSHARSPSLPSAAAAPLWQPADDGPLGDRDGFSPGVLPPSLVALNRRLGRAPPHGERDFVAEATSVHTGARKFSTSRLMVSSYNSGV
jgi:hypothetical protein